MAQQLRPLLAISRGSGFHSQHPHGISQPSVTPIPGDLTPFLTSTGTRQALVVQRSL